METVIGLVSTMDFRLITGKGKEPGLITVSGYEEEKRVRTCRINKEHIKFAASSSKKKNK